MRTTNKIADCSARADSVSLLPASPAGRLAPVVISGDNKPKRVTLSCRQPGEPLVAVASLELKNQSLFWRWNDVSAPPMAGAMGRLDEILRTSLIRLQASNGKVVTVFQCEPTKIEIRPRFKPKPVSLKIGDVKMKLKPDNLRPGWSVTNCGDEALRFAHDKGEFTMTLVPAGKILTAAWKADKSERNSEPIAAMAEGIRKLENKNKRLVEQRRAVVRDAKKKEKSDKFSRSLYYKYKIKELDGWIAENKLRIADATKKLTALKTPMASRRKTEYLPDVSGCSARVVLPNGVVLYRIVLKN